MKIRLNVTRGDRLAEVEWEADDGNLLVREDLARFAADAFAALEAAVDAGPPPPPEQGREAPIGPRPASPRPAREPGDDEPGRAGPVPAQARPGPVRGDGGPPRNGKQLWAWASNHSCLDRLKTLSRTQPGRIVDWPEDLVQWAYRELTAKQAAGKWGRN